MFVTTIERPLKNSYIQSLESQIGHKTNASTRNTLAIVSGNSNLDTAAVSRLLEAGVLVLRTDSEALSRALETGPLAEAINWATTEAGVSSLTLVGHSMAATIPLDNSSKSLGLLERVQRNGERIESSKLKLKDDLARFNTHSQVKSLIADAKLELHALFYLHESGVFLKYDGEKNDFVLLG